MFRKSFVVFVATVLMALLFCIGYASLGLSGTADTLARAERYLAQGGALDAIRELDRAEGSTLDDPALHRRLLVARYRAHRQVDNHARALLDVRQLAVQPGPEQEGYRLDEIWLLARTGHAEEGLRAAQEFLRQSPDHARALELAGEAAAATYQPALAAAAVQLRTDLGEHAEKRGRDAMLDYLYRQDGDPGVANGLSQLADLYRAQARLQQSWLTFQPQLRNLRARVQQALQYYARSLERGGKPVAAWRGLDFALQQSRRTFDRLMLATIHQYRFRHRYVVEAVAAQSSTHLEGRRPEAALACIERFVPAGKLAAAAEERLITEDADAMLTDKAWALFELQRGPALHRFAGEVGHVFGSGVRVLVAAHTCGALSGLLQRSDRDAEAHLTALCNLLGAKPPPLAGIDRLPRLFELRLEVLQRRGATDDEVRALFDAWLHADGRSRESALLQRARWQLARGDGAAALASSQEILQLHRSEAALRLLAEATDLALQPAGQDGKALFAHCVRQRVSVPNAQEPVGLLSCGEVALAQGHPHIAAACGSAAIDRFPWSSWPRLLAARALIAAGQPDAAVDLLATAVTLFPDQREVLAWLLQARRQAGVEYADLLPALLQHRVADPAVWEGLLRSALQHGAHRVAADLARTAPQFATTAAQFALAARALAAAGQLDDAESALSAGLAAARAETAVPLELSLAAAAVIAAQARNGNVAEASRRVAGWRDFLILDPQAGTAWLAAARALADQAPPIALQLLHVLLDSEAATALRSGGVYALAGHLSLQVGDLTAAERHLTAALPFADGAEAIEPLARLLVAKDDLRRAARVLALLDAPTDPALAELLEHPAAAALQQSATARDRGELIAQLVAARGTAAAAGAFGSEWRQERGDAGLAWRCALALAGEPALAGFALQRLATAEAARPESPAAAVLRARLLGDLDRRDEARELLLRASAEAPESPVLLTELVRLADLDGTPLPRAQFQAALKALTPTTIRFLPRLAAHATERAAREALIAGQRARAALLYAELARNCPAALRLSPTAAMEIAAAGQVEAAVAILQALRLHHPQHAAAAADGLLMLATRGLAPDSAQHRLGEVLAREVLAGPHRHGAAVNFLFAADRVVAAAAPERAMSEDQARALLSGLLARAAHEPDDALVLALSELHRRFGPNTALVAATPLLAARPHSVGLWSWRNDVLRQEQRASEGLVPLLTLAQLVGNTGLRLQAVTMAAELTEPHDLDPSWIAGLRADDPDAAHARGLLALRNGDAATAVREFAAGPPRPHGGHLFFGALATLSAGGPDAGATAHAMLSELARDYPSSSLARYAGSFALQLAPN